MSHGGNSGTRKKREQTRGGEKKIIDGQKERKGAASQKRKQATLLPPGDCGVNSSTQRVRKTHGTVKEEKGGQRFIMV